MESRGGMGQTDPYSPLRRQHKLLGGAVMEPQFYICCCRPHLFLPTLRPHLFLPTLHPHLFLPTLRPHLFLPCIHTCSSLPCVHTCPSPAFTHVPPLLTAAVVYPRSPVPALVDVVNLLVQHLGALLIDALEVTEQA